MPHGISSVLIPIAVILLAAATKKIIPSLIAGLLMGGFLLAGGNVINGMTQVSDHLIKSAANEESICIIFFLFLFGSFAEIMKVSGGIKGFTKLTQRFVKTERGALGAVWAVTPVTFIDCCFHDISAGTVGKALIDKVNGNRRKLAFVLNVTSSLLLTLIPFGTTYVGYIMGLITAALAKTNTVQTAYGLYLESIPYNFFSILMILISIGVTLFNLGFKKEFKAVEGDSQFETEHWQNEAHEQCSFEENAPPRPLNLILPLSLLILTTFFFLWLTGRGSGGDIWNAFLHADFEKSIFISSFLTIALTSVYYLSQKMPLREIESHFLSGGAEMLPPIVVLILSWGLSAIIGDLGFASVITGFAAHVPKFLIPASIYLTCCFTSYFMGSAWGTWALIMPMAISLAVSAGLNLPLIVGAVLGGGALGDNASPLGETAILSSTIAELPLMEHVKSQLPYSLAGVAVSAALYIAAAFI